MPRYRSQSSSFASGELSPGAQDRIDSELFASGAELLDNVLVRRGGGVETRPGLRRVDAGGEIRFVPTYTEYEAFTEGTRWVRFLGGERINNIVVPGTQGFYTSNRFQVRTMAADRALGYVGPFFNEPERTEGPIANFDFQAFRITDLVNGGLQGTVQTGVDAQGVLTRAPVTVDGEAVADGNALPVAGKGHLRYMLRLFQLEPSLPWPLRTLTLRNVQLSTLTGLGVTPRPLSYFQEPSDSTRAGYEAGKWYPRYAFIGSVAGFAREQWFSLTGTGPYDSLADLREDALVIETRALIEEQVVSLAPAPVAWTNTQAALMEAYLRFGNGAFEGLGFDRIALVELACDERFAGQVQWRVGEVSGRYSTGEQDLEYLRGTRASEIRTATAAEGAGTRIVPDSDSIRVVEWLPEPGRGYLVQVHRGGASIVEVPGPGVLLQEPIPATYDFTGIALSEMTFADAPGALYCFHEQLEAPVILRPVDGGGFAFTPLAFSTGIPATPEGDAYWGGGGGGVRAGVFAYGRLCLIGSGRFPNMLAFSRVGDVTDFVPPAVTQDTPATPDQPFFALTAGTESLHGGILGRRLVLFGDRAEYFLSSEEISGRRLDFSQTSAHGSPRGGRALVVDDAIVFRQRGTEGRSSDLRMMVFSDEESGFRTPSLAPFSAHLVQGVEAYAYQAGSDEGGARLWCVRSDGTMSVLSIDRAAQVNAWTRLTPPAGVRPFEVASIGNRVFVLADVFGEPVLLELSYNASTGSVLDLAQVIESFEPGAIADFDEAIRSVFRETGQMPWVFSDRDVPFQVEEVTPSGTVILPDQASLLTNGARVEIGLRVRWTIRTLPVLSRTASGTAVSVQKSRIVRAMVDYEVSGDAPQLAVERIREPERYRPGMRQWPRRIEVEDSRGLWLPLITVPASDSEDVMRCKLGARRGWRNRTTLALRGYTPCALVGVGFMYAGGG